MAAPRRLSAQCQLAAGPRCCVVCLTCLLARAVHLQGSSSSDVIKLPVAQQPFLIGNGPSNVAPNPYFNITVLARVVPGVVPQGPKGMALVSRAACSRGQLWRGRLHCVWPGHELVCC